MIKSTERCVLRTVNPLLTPLSKKPSLFRVLMSPPPPPPAPSLINVRLYLVLINHDCKLPVDC